MARNGRLLVATTQSEYFMSQVFSIFIMSNGKIVDRGTFTDLQSKDEKSEILQLINPTSKFINQSPNEMQSDIILQSDQENNENSILVDTNVEAEQVEELEFIESGKVNTNVYMTYYKSAGYILSICVFISTLLMQGSSTIVALWWSTWASQVGNFTDSEFIQITLLLVVINIMFALVRSFLFAWAGLKAASRLYRDLTSSIFSTYLSFFEKTSIGRIVNRFGKVSCLFIFIFIYLN